MFLESKNVLRAQTTFLELEPDGIKQDSPSQKCSKNNVIRALSGRPIGTPGRLATARLLLHPSPPRPGGAPAAGGTALARAMVSP
eukprot:2282072-Pyramimonas_sp.AAC.1